MFFNLIEHHTKFLLHALRVLYTCTLRDSANINTRIEVVPHVSGDGFNGSSDSYLQFRNIHAPCLLKLLIVASNGIVIWWLFPEFSADSPLDNCTLTIILNNPVYSQVVKPVIHSPYRLNYLKTCFHKLTEKINQKLQ